MSKTPVVKMLLLEGTASPVKWRIVDEKKGKSSAAATDPTEAIFPIFGNESGKWNLVGTGFYITSNGAFVTARHVAEEFSSKGLVATIIHINPDGTYLLRPVRKWSLHGEADVAIGWPGVIKDNKSGAEYVGVRLVCQNSTNLTEDELNKKIGEPVMTYGFPLHQIQADDFKTSIHLQPNMYDGTIEAAHWLQGPSVKLSPPYFQTSIYLYGASRGGPVFSSTDGSVIGVACASYDGANNFSFITPIAKAMEILIPSDMVFPKQYQPISIGQFLEDTLSGQIDETK